MASIINGIGNLPRIIREINCRKLFLVIDSSYPYLNIKDTIEQLPVEGMVKFSGFTPNPVFEQVYDGVELLKSSHCDTILAIGGGSAIDVAKCIKLAFLAEDGISALLPTRASQDTALSGSRVPLIAVPTTAGTGSESTHNAVMYYKGVKQTITHDGILPDYAILEPAVLQSLPLYQKKCTMMDALCQGIESWWSVNSTPESRTYSRKALELIVANWRKYIFENDGPASAQIMLAANYSGRAINIAQTTAPHAMSYKITSMYGLPHGHAVAICLPEVWQYMLAHAEECIDARGSRYLDNVFQEIAQALSFTRPADAVTFMHSILTEMEMPYPVAKDRMNEIEMLTRSVNPLRLKNNPVGLSQSSLSALYESIVK